VLEPIFVNKYTQEVDWIVILGDDQLSSPENNQHKKEQADSVMLCQT
jgi:hypothetical protein